MKITFLTIVMLISGALAYGQIMPSNNETKPAEPKKPVYTPIPVEVTWQGDQNVKITIGGAVKAFKPNETITIVPPMREALKIQVETPASVFYCKSFFEAENSPGFLTIYLKDNEVSYTYKTKRSIMEEKAAEDAAAASKLAAEKAEAQRAADEKIRIERDAATRIAADKEAQRKAIAEKVAAEKIAQSNLSKMILVEGGTFTMGCTKEQEEEGCLNIERPSHDVTLHPFYINKYDVTQDQWYSLMGTNPSKHRECGTCPVEQISWNDAMEFINKLNLLTGKSYRLPTEAEWEYAARGGSQSKHFKFAGGNNIDDVAWHDGNSQSASQPVGMKAPNELGLYDMTGNVWQWCNDWSDDNYYSASPHDNPTGPDTGTDKVARGGSFVTDGKACHVSFRSKMIPADGGLPYFGFRLAGDTQ